MSTLSDEQIDEIATRYATMTVAGWLFRSESVLRDFAGEIASSALPESAVREKGASPAPVSKAKAYAWRQSLEKGERLCREDGHQGDAATLLDIAMFIDGAALAPSPAGEREPIPCAVCKFQEGCRRHGSCRQMYDHAHPAAQPAAPSSSGEPSGLA
jgi:hypothetical protein